MLEFRVGRLVGWNFVRFLFEHVEIFSRQALKVLVSERQYKLHNNRLFGSSLLSFVL